MAYMEVLDYIDIGTDGQHTATSWQFAKDPDFTKIIAESIEDEVNVKKWINMLPMLPEDIPVGSNPGDPDTYYKDLDNVYGRFRVHMGKSASAWYECEPKSQNWQEVIITEEGIEDIHTTSDAINMQ